MTRKLYKRILPRLLLFASSATTVLAQSPATEKAAPTGSISGHVYCADTNAPARMATVTLEAAKDIDSYSSDAKEPSSILMTSVQTLLDGSFTIQHVAPGSYYVIATAAGYVSPLAAVSDSDEDLRKPGKEVKERYSKLVPKVNIQGNLGATVEVRLERGAAVSGTVHFDDGSPAAGLTILPLVREHGEHKDKWAPFSGGVRSFSGELRTDDQGNYRISGLPGREYLLEVDLRLTKTLTSFTGESSGSSTNFQYSLPVYTGGIFSTRDAKPFTVKLGEERPDENIEIPLAKLHSLSGNIIAARDGHIVNGGSVKLLHSDDKSQVAEASLSKDESTFTFSFVPEGDYLLSSTGASDVEYTEKMNPPGTMPPSNIEQKSLYTYGSAEQPIHIEGDVAAATVSVPDLAAKPAQP